MPAARARRGLARAADKGTLFLNEVADIPPIAQTTLLRFVERFFAWINRNRRLWKNTEATIASATAFLHAAAAMVLIRRIARSA